MAGLVCRWFKFGAIAGNNCSNYVSEDAAFIPTRVEVKQSRDRRWFGMPVNQRD